MILWGNFCRKNWHNARFYTRANSFGIMSDKINNKSFKLPASVTIADVEAVHSEMLKLSGDVSIDASSSDSITTPGIQLLISLSKKISSEGGKFTITEPSKSFVQVFETLGLKQQLTQWSS